jgi:hypothetical protein
MIAIEINYLCKAMSRPIKNTPVLKGKDAINFFATIDQNRDKKVDKSYLLSIRESARQLQSILRHRNK